MQRNSLCQFSGGCYKCQEVTEYPRVWTLAILCYTHKLPYPRFQEEYISKPRGEGTVSQMAIRAICHAYAHD